MTLKSREQNLDGRYVLIDPSFDGAQKPAWDVPTLEQLKAKQRLSNWEYKKEKLKYEGQFRSPSLAQELRFNTTLTFLQPYIETGVAMGIWIDRLITLST